MISDVQRIYFRKVFTEINENLENKHLQCFSFAFPLLSIVFHNFSIDFCYVVRDDL
jgi:hypothetical protein